MLPWILTRCLGIGAYLSLSALVVVGLWFRHPWRVARRIPGPEALLRTHVALATATAVLLVGHIVAVCLDSFAGVGWVGAFVPWASAYRPTASAWGRLAMYGIVLVAGTGHPGRLGRAADLASDPFVFRRPLRPLCRPRPAGRQRQSRSLVDVRGLSSTRGCTPGHAFIRPISGSRGGSVSSAVLPTPALPRSSPRAGRRPGGAPSRRPGDPPKVPSHSSSISLASDLPRCSLPRMFSPRSDAAGSRGGEGEAFPLHRKLRDGAAVAWTTAPRRQCSESEPASRKDQALCSYRPHVVLEGAAAIAKALGAA